jgi:hypothetical protein
MYRPLLAGIQGKEKWKVSKVLASFDTRVIPDIIHAVGPLFKSMSLAKDRVKFLKTVALIPNEDRVGLLHDIRPYLECLTSSSDKCELLKNLKTFDPMKRGLIFKKGLPFIGKKDTSLEHLHLIQELQQFQTSEDWSLLDYARKLMNCEMSLQERIEMIQSMKKVPIDLQKSFFQTAEILLQSVKLKNRSELLRYILKEDHPFILKKMSWTIDFGRQHFKNPLHQNFMMKLMQCSDEKSSSCLKISHRLIQLKDLDKPVEFFKALEKFEVDELSSLCSWLEIYRPDHRKKGRALSYYLSQTRILMKESLGYLLTLDPAKPLTGVHSEFFLNYLEEHESDQDSVFFVAEHILNDFESLQIHEESPLFLKALQIFFLKDISDPHDPLNPYRIFKNHVESSSRAWKLQNPKVFFNQTEYFFDLKTSLNQSLQQTVHNTDLVKGVDPQIFPNAFIELEERLLCLEALLRDQIFGRIQETTGLLFSQLKENLFDPFFEIALASPLKKGSNVPIHAVKLLQIALWFQAIPQRAGEIEGLSEKETALVQISACIANCSEGKRQGVHRAYKFLPGEFRIQNISSSELDILETFTYSQLTPFIESLLEEENYILELLRPKVIHKIQELPHHQTFVRNKISRFLGLPHSVVFDAHTGVLIRNLVFVHEQKMLDIFFRMFAPEQLLEKLCSHYAGLPEGTKRGIFNQLNEHTQSNQLEDFWNLDTPEILMTPRGALEVLLMLKIFSPKMVEEP